MAKRQLRVCVSPGVVLSKTADPIYHRHARGADEPRGWHKYRIDKTACGTLMRTVILSDVGVHGAAPFLVVRTAKKEFAVPARRVKVLAHRKTRG